MIMNCKYRVRCFSSKGAFLVLLWTLLVIIVIESLQSVIINTASFPWPKDQTGTLYWLAAIPLSMLLVSAPLSGWLADAKFGNYKVFRFGAVLLFFSTVMISLFFIFKALYSESSNVLNGLICAYLIASF